MKKLVCIRHGESEWNKENRFTGWSDVDLSEKGHEEAKEAGKILKQKDYTFDIAYTSVLKRAIHTLDHVSAGHQMLAAQRTSLRRPSRTQQSRYGRQIRRRTSSPMETLVRCASSPDGSVRSACAA